MPNEKSLMELAADALTKCADALTNDVSGDYKFGCAKLAEGVAALICAELHKNDPRPT